MNNHSCVTIVDYVAGCILCNEGEILKSSEMRHNDVQRDEDTQRGENGARFSLRENGIVDISLINPHVSVESCESHHWRGNEKPEVDQKCVDVAVEFTKRPFSCDKDTRGERHYKRGGK